MESKKPSGTKFKYIDIDAINNENQTIKSVKTLNSSKAPSRASRKVYASSTLFSMVRPYLRNIAYVGLNNQDCIASTGFYVCTPMPFVDGKYLYLLLTSDYIVDRLNYHMKGDNSPSIKTGDIEEMYFPIPTLTYQKTIVSLFEKIMPMLEQLRVDYNELSKLLDKYKCKLLDVIFSENSTYKSYYENWVPLQDIIELIPSTSKEIKSRDIIPVGKYPVVSQGKQIIDGYSNESEKVIHDVPVIIFGDHTRTVKYIDFEFIPGGDGTKILKNVKTYDKYLYYCILYASLVIEDRGYNRHFSLLNKVTVPIATPDKQKEIVKYIDGIFSILSSI